MEPVIRSSKWDHKIEVDSLREFCEKLITDGNTEEIRQAAYQLSFIWSHRASKRSGK